MKKEPESRKQAPLSESRHIMPNKIKVTEIENKKFVIYIITHNYKFAISRPILPGVGRLTRGVIRVYLCQENFRLAFLDISFPLVAPRDYKKLKGGLKFYVYQ
ncbi:hypothetical protein ES705_17590 [subsurface metagenome]